MFLSCPPGSERLATALPSSVNNERFRKLIFDRQIGQAWGVGHVCLTSNFLQNFPIGLHLPPLTNFRGSRKSRIQRGNIYLVTVAYSVRELINKTHLKLLQEGFKVEPQRIFVKNIFSPKILGIFFFFFFFYLYL